jgi:hypothetical protein
MLAGYDDGFVNTSPVGSFAGNRFGLFDLGGNLAQWCEDFYDQNQKERVLRGGAWNFGDRNHLLSSRRDHLLAVTMQLEKGPPFGSCWFYEELSTGKPQGFDSPNGDRSDQTQNG